MDKYLRQQLQQMGGYIPEPNREKELRVYLLSRIRAYQGNRTREGMLANLIKEALFLFIFPWRTLPLVRNFCYLCIGIVFAVSVVALSSTAGPGDALYSIKISIEHIPVTVPLVPEKVKVETEIKYAHNRQNEIIAIIQSTATPEDKSKKIQEAGKELRRILTSTQRRVEKISKRDRPVLTVGVAASVKASASDIRERVGKVSQGSADIQNSKKIEKELEKIYAAASLTELSSLTLMVEAAGKIDSKEIGAGEVSAGVSQAQKVDDQKGSRIGEEKAAEGSPKLVSEKQASQKLIFPREEQRTAKGEAIEEEVRNKRGVEDVKQEGLVEEGIAFLEEAQLEEINKEAMRESGVTDGEDIKAAVKQDLTVAIAGLRKRISQLNAQDIAAEEREDKGEPENKEDISIDEATFSVEEVLLRELREKNTKEADALIGEAEQAVAKDDFKGALDLIKKAQEVLEAAEWQGLQV